MYHYPIELSFFVRYGSEIRDQKKARDQLLINPRPEKNALLVIIIEETNSSTGY